MTSPAAPGPGDLLRAYDDQLRERLSSALTQDRLGPLVLATYLGGRGFVTYRSLEEDGRPATEASVLRLVEQAMAYYEAAPEIAYVEWKTRGHDHAPGLHEALLDRGFAPDEPESIMIGEARLLARDIGLPDGVTVRQAADEDDVRRMHAMQSRVFGDPPERAEAHLGQILHRLRTRNDMELWLAEADGEVVSAGRLEPEPGTDFAGIWGGATTPEWRGRGVYRALTAARARSAIAHGKRWITSDSTELSRPILERSGLVKVSTTTPYEWRRGTASTRADSA